MKKKNGVHIAFIYLANCLYFSTKQLKVAYDWHLFKVEKASLKIPKYICCHHLLFLLRF